MNLIIFENVTLVSEPALLYLVFIWVFINFRCVIVMLVIFLEGVVILVGRVSPRLVSSPSGLAKGGSLLPGQ